jgi:S-adenosylmethionine:tRNA ribosyltransferase-isomerase
MPMDFAPSLGFPDIPAELIAQEPLSRRDAARLLALDRATGKISHHIFADIGRFLRPGDVLVLNDVRVFPARLSGKKPTGGRVKILLLKRFAPSGGTDRWTALLSPSQKPGAIIHFDETLSAGVRDKIPTGEYVLEFTRPLDGDLARLGVMPLPPYIRRPDRPDPVVTARDRDYYQAVYASPSPPPPTDGSPHAPGAVAAPTAGLHFTPALLESLRQSGVATVFIQLFVGWGTFRPVTVGDYRKHAMLPEEYWVTPQAAQTVNAARSRGGRVAAVGTTVVRTLETLAADDGSLRPGSGETGLFITPGHRFRAVDVLITNFHMPRHTPLLLAAAFAGTENLRRAHLTALAERYRFLSYGDAMVVL